MSGELVIRDEQQYLARLDEIRAMIDQLETVEDAKDLADKARAAEVWARRAHLHYAKVVLAIITKLGAERRAGELLGETVRPRGRNSSGNGALPEGVTKMQSSRWQKLAEIDLDEFDAILREAGEAERLSLAEVFRRVDRARREKAAAEEEAQLLDEVRRRGGAHASITHADMREFDPGPVDAIITDPPYVTDDALELYAELGRFALRTLKPGGVLAAMVSHPILLPVLEALSQPELRYRWMICWLSGAHESRSDQRYRVFDRWKPVLVYHLNSWSERAPMVTDVISSGRDQQKGAHPWQQTLVGMRQLVRSLANPGDTICDPFLGAGTTAVAALAESCDFVGCDIDPAAIATTNERLAA